jgi:hypothetical protein
MRVYKCHVGECHVGYLTIEDNGIMSFEWCDDDNFTEVALKYKKYVDLNSDAAIKRWMNERVIQEERPDRSLWLSMSGIPVNASKLDIFIGTGGRSINDIFWFEPCEAVNRQ